MPAEKGNPLLSALPLESRTLVLECTKLQPKITCTKCTHQGTLTHTENSQGKTPQPIFTCNNCHCKLTHTAMQREITQARAQPAEINSEIATISTSASEPALDKQKRTTTTATKKRKTAENTAQINETTTNTTDHSTCIEMFQTLQDRITQLETKLQETDMLRNKISQLETQLLQNTNNKNATLEAQILQLKTQQKLNKLSTVTPSIIEEDDVSITDVYEEEIDVVMDDDAKQIIHNKQHQRSASTPVLLSGTNKSKWANAPDTKPLIVKNNNIDKNKKSKKTIITNNQQQFDWIEVAKKGNKNQQKQKKIAMNQEKKKEIAIRAFEVPEQDMAGFTHVYFPSKTRFSRNTQKNYLKTIGVDTARIIDIHYPAKNIIAILVHKMYAEEFKTIMSTAGIKSNTKFNSLDPSCYASHPALKNMTEEQKLQTTLEKNNKRLIRALPFMRKSCSKSVAQFFYQEKLISESQLLEFLENVATTSKQHSSKTTQPTNGPKDLIPTANKDINMEDVPTVTTNKEQQQQ